MSSLADGAERFLRALAEPDAVPTADECLLCYVARRLEVHPCDHWRTWTTRFRDDRSPSATALEDRLFRQGVLCDCGLFARYGWQRGGALLRRDLVTTRATGADAPPPCDGVHRTSTQPCGLWERRTEPDRWRGPPPAPGPEVEPPF